MTPVVRTLVRLWRAWRHRYRVHRTIAGHSRHTAARDASRHTWRQFDSIEDQLDHRDRWKDTWR